MVEKKARSNKALLPGGGIGFYPEFPMEKHHPLPAQNDKHPLTRHHTRARNVLRWGTIFTEGLPRVKNPHIVHLSG